MAEAYFPDGAAVYVVAADAAIDTTSSLQLTDYCTNFSQSGGTRETESIPVFGGGNITKENPRDQIELSFDVIVDPARAAIFDEMMFTSNLTGTTASITSDGEGQALKIGVYWVSGGQSYIRTYNNCYMTSWDPTMSADGQLEGSISFKMAPTTSSGTANLTITTDATA